MKIAKGHYVPKELITSEAVHEAVVKCFVAAGFKDKRPEFGRYIDRNEAFGLVCSDLGNACWTGKAHEKDALTLQQLFTAENGLQWPDWAESVQCGDDGVFFTSANKGVIQFIAGSFYQADSAVLATRQPKEKGVKTIKDAVIVLNGKIPDENDQGCFRAAARSIYYVEGENGVRLGSFEEFEAEAKRMGYINGYEWGKEYPTNGKRPELPDDVLVDVTPARNEQKKWSADRVDNWIWDNSKLFEITDPRYKPVDEVSEAERLGIQPPMNKNERCSMQEKNNSWYERGLLPNSGEKVELWIGGHYKEDVEFICRRKFDLVFWRFANDSVDSASTPTAEVRPIKTQREKVIEAAVMACTGVNIPTSTDGLTMNTLNKLYNAGMLVLPKDSGDTKD